MALTGWENFYVIVGSSAGALIGLQFVVIALIADLPNARGHAQAGSAFATPTAGCIGIRGSLEGWQGTFWRWSGGVAVALHRHS